jgi:hypothetical protein
VVNKLKLDFIKDDYTFITDDTSKLDKETLFLKTAQNTPYYEKLEVKPKSITPEELIVAWELSDMRVVGVTGTNGKTTVTAAIYSFLLDLDERDDQFLQCCTTVYKPITTALYSYLVDGLGNEKFIIPLNA